MGSWYGTCGVSQLPIMYDDEVMLFFLKANKSTLERDKNDPGGGGFVHSDALYKPVCLPIFGKYSDCGRIDNIMDIDNISTIHLQCLKATKNGEEYNINNLEDFIYQIERNKIDDYGFMMVHKELYDKLLIHIKAAKDWFTYGYTFGELFKKDIKEFLQISKETNPLTFYHTKITRLQGNIFREKTEYDSNLKYYRNHELYENNNQLMDDVVDFLLFIEIMSHSRKLWIPQAGSGSQDVEYDVAKLIGDFAKDKIKEREEW